MQRVNFHLVFSTDAALAASPLASDVFSELTEWINEVDEKFKIVLNLLL